MPFIELKRPKDFVRIKKNGIVTISVNLSDKFFILGHVKIFHDEKLGIIGFKPSSDGYKIFGTEVKRIRCAELSRIAVGEFYPTWSAKHEMLTMKYPKGEWIPRE